MKKQVYYYLSSNGVVWAVSLAPAVALALSIVKGVTLHNNKNDLKAF